MDSVIKPFGKRGVREGPSAHRVVQCTLAGSRASAGRTSRPLQSLSSPTCEKMVFG